LQYTTLNRRSTALPSSPILSRLAVRFSSHHYPTYKAKHLFEALSPPLLYTLDCEKVSSTIETAHIPALFSKQGWLRPYIVQGSTVQYRLSVGPGGWTMVALERAADVFVCKRSTAGLRIIFKTAN